MANDSSDTDALLKDLESRASSSKSAAPSKGESGGDEDIEAFLRSLEGDDYVAPPKEKETKSKAAPKPVKTKPKDALDAKFAGIEEAPDAPLEKAPPKKKQKESRKERKAREKAEAEAAKAAVATEVVKSEGKAPVEANGVRNFVRFLKVFAFVVPSGLAVWLLGSYLGAWVSASWLIAALSLAVIFGLPLVALLASKRGRYLWWTIGLSLVALTVLIAPMTGSAQKALENHGHWPGSAIAQGLGAGSDHVLVRAAASVGSFIGQLIHPVAVTELTGPKRLGSEDLLNPLPVDPTAPPVAPTAPAIDPSAAPPNPVQPPPQPVQPQPVQPQPQPAPTQPAPQPTQPSPQPAPTQPAPAPVDPAPQPNPAPTQPQPQPDAVKPNPDPTQPQPNPAQPSPETPPTPQPSEQPTPSP